MNQVLAALYDNNFYDVGENPRNYPKYKRDYIVRLIKKLLREEPSKVTSQMLQTKIRIDIYEIKIS